LAEGAILACLVLGARAATASDASAARIIIQNLHSAAAEGVRVRELHSVSIDVPNQQLEDIESKAAQARRGAKQEIEQARTQSQDFPVAAHEKLMVAIERAGRARDQVRDRLNELERANEADWDASRQRVVDALAELAGARRDVVAAFAGGEPALYQGS
jgi:hypothetical protein